MDAQALARHLRPVAVMQHTGGAVGGTDERPTVLPQSIQCQGLVDQALDLVALAHRLVHFQHLRRGPARHRTGQALVRIPQADHARRMAGQQLLPRRAQVMRLVHQQHAHVQRRGNAAQCQPLADVRRAEAQQRAPLQFGVEHAAPDVLGGRHVRRHVEHRGGHRPVEMLERQARCRRRAPTVDGLERSQQHLLRAAPTDALQADAAGNLARRAGAAPVAGNEATGVAAARGMLRHAVGELDLGQQAHRGAGRHAAAEGFHLPTRGRHVGVAAGPRLHQRQHQVALAGAGIAIEVDQLIGVGGDGAQHAGLLGGVQAMVFDRTRVLGGHVILRERLVTGKGGGKADLMLGQGFLAGLLQGQARILQWRLRDDVLQDLRRRQQHAVGGQCGQPGIQLRLASATGAGQLRGGAFVAGKQRAGIMQQAFDLGRWMQARPAQLRGHQPGLLHCRLRRRAVSDVTCQRLALQRQEDGGGHRVLEFGHAWNRKGTLRRAQGGDARLPARPRQIAAALIPAATTAMPGNPSPCAARSWNWRRPRRRR